LVNRFGSEGLSQPWPNIREVVLIPNLPPELETYFLEVLPGINVWIDDVPYVTPYVNGTGLLLVMVSYSYNSKSKSMSPSTV
jgi:hypothetical protein